jgi:hypothetical protein
MKTLKAKAGFIVRDPDSGEELTDKPITVEMTPFWWRRLSRQEVEEVKSGPDGPRTKPMEADKNGASK